MATSRKALTTKTLTKTFQDINKNTIKNIFIEDNIADDITVKERHGSLAIKLFPNNIINSNFSEQRIDDDSFDNSIDEVKSFISESEINEDIDEKVGTNNFKKYGYTCITFLTNNVKNKNQQMKIIDFKKTLKIEEERKNRINALIKNNDVAIVNINKELFSLKAIHEEVVNDRNINKKIDSSNIQKRVKLEFEIKEKEKQLTEYQKEKKKLFTYSFNNQKNIKSLRDNVNMLKVEIKKDSIEVKIEEKEQASKNLETKINNTLSENHQEKLMWKKLKLDKEIVTLKQENDQVVTKIYEEIVLQENFLYFITTLLHNNKSITEEVVYIENDESGEPNVWTQIKRYQNINIYEKDNLIIEPITRDNKDNFSCIPIKKFLLNLEAEKSKISKSEWGIFISVTFLSVALLLIAPVSAPFLLAIAWEKALISAIGVSIAWIVNKGINALVADKTKKVEALMKKKVFSWIRKIFNKRSIGKTKEELDIKNNIDKITENLKNEKFETRLSAQFSILKSLLNVRKDIKANELITEKKNLKVKNDITTVNDKSFNANKVNDFDRQLATNEYTKKRHFSI